MTELHPTDAELNALSGTVDAEQEVPFLTIGESPYYTSFYRMLYRLLDVARRAGDLRVFKDGELTFGVRAGSFFDGAELRQYAGSGGNALTNNATNYIYLDGAGTLHVATDEFPPPSTPHVRLATVTTSAGAYTHEDISDRRGAAMFSTTSAVSAAQLRDSLPALEITASEQSGDTRTVTCRVTDAAGDDLAGRFAVRLWVTTSEFGPPDATGNTVTVSAGTLLREIAANADYELITAADGSAAIDLAVTAPATRRLCAEIDGRIYSSDELAWTQA
ncbi:MAG: hypothetical protein ACP5HU_10995 [Phycisphaerae bacterium]